MHKRLMHASRLLFSRYGRIRQLNRNPLASEASDLLDSLAVNQKTQKLEQCMQSQADLANDQKSPLKMAVEDADMMQKILNVHGARQENQVEEKVSESDWYLDAAHNIPEEWKDFVPKWQKSMRKLPQEKVLEDDPILTLAALIDTIKKENGVGSIAINMAKKCDYTDALIFTQGNNGRHVAAIAEAVKKLAKSKISTDSSLPNQIYSSDAKGQDWIIVDMGKFIVHVFTAEVREYYDLEGLWTFVVDPSKDAQIKNDLTASNLLKVGQEEKTNQ